MKKQIGEIRESVTDFDFAYEASSGQKYVGVFVTGVVVTSEVVPVGTGKLDDVVIDIQPDFEGPANVMMIGDFDSGDMSPEFTKFVDNSGSMPGPKSEAETRRDLEAFAAALEAIKEPTYDLPTLRAKKAELEADMDALDKSRKQWVKLSSEAKSAYENSMRDAAKFYGRPAKDGFFEAVDSEVAPEQLRFPVNTTLVNPSVRGYGMPGTGKSFVAPVSKPSDKKVVYEITDGTEGMRCKEGPKPEVF